MTVPKLFATYKEDFGVTDENILKYVFRFYKCGENGYDIDEE
jgi:hypothetical protein